MNSYYETTGFIYVGGEIALTPDEISDIVGIQPTKTSIRTIRNSERINWFFTTEQTDTIQARSVDETVNQMLSSIAHMIKNLRNLPKECERRMIVTVYSDYSNNMIDVSHTTMRLMSEVPIDLRVSIYGADEE